MHSAGGPPVRDYPLVPDVVASIPIRGITPTHSTNCQGFMFSWNSFHVFVPHGNFVSAVTSSGEIGCRLTAVTRSINSRKSPRPREVAGGYIDRDGAILASLTLKTLRSPEP